MTYIAAFRCLRGVVMCADTLETFGEYKNYVEKLEIDDKYPIAIGGSGAAEIVDAVTQEIVQRCKKAKPHDRKAFKKVITESVATVFRDDVPVLVLKRQSRSPQFLVSARLKKDEFCILKVTGRRVFEVSSHAIIGYGTSYNNALLSRLHREDLPMAQAVILASYLVSQSKLLDDGVGGETRVTVVTERGVFQEKPSYISYVESRANDFIKKTDALFLECLDTSLGVKRLRRRIETFTQDAIAQYKKHIDSTLESLTMKCSKTSPIKSIPPTPQLASAAADLKQRMMKRRTNA